MAITQVIPLPKKAPSWSFSRLGDFSKCKLMYKIKHIDKVPEPERPLPKGKLEHGNDRGTRVHSNCEEYIRGEHDDLCSEANKHFGFHIDLLRTLYAEGKVEMEEDWAFDKDWNIAPWKTGWVRMKVDALVHVSKIEACVIDFKTGRMWGNEVTHSAQLSLYALSTFLRFPELEVISTADWYIDHGEITEKIYTRDQALRFKRSFNNQGIALTTCAEFPANPNQFSCRWCPYGPGPDGTGHCSVGVRKT